MRPGTQVVYKPSWLDDDKTIKDKARYIEYGFVTSLHSDGKRAFVRYFVSKTDSELRTTSNSVLTNITDLTEQDSHDQALVNKLMNEFRPRTVAPKGQRPQKIK